MQHINPRPTWGQRFRQLLLEGFPAIDHLVLNLAGMGADEGWEQRYW